MFQLYRSHQFYWWRKLEYPETTTDLSHVTDNNVVFELTMLVMIVIDCIGSYESNYDIITTTTVASEIVNNLDHVHVYYKPMIFTEVTEHVNVLNE